MSAQFMPVTTPNTRNKRQIIPSPYQHHYKEDNPHISLKLNTRSGSGAWTD